MFSFYLAIYGLLIVNSRHVCTGTAIAGWCFDWANPCRQAYSKDSFDTTTGLFINCVILANLVQSRGGLSLIWRLWWFCPGLACETEMTQDSNHGPQFIAKTSHFLDVNHTSCVSQLLSLFFITSNFWGFPLVGLTTMPLGGHEDISDLALVFIPLRSCRHVRVCCLCSGIGANKSTLWQVMFISQLSR